LIAVDRKSAQGREMVMALVKDIDAIAPRSSNAARHECKASSYASPAGHPHTPLGVFPNPLSFPKVKPPLRKAWRDGFS
jgi:hypothetical protein